MNKAPAVILIAAIVMAGALLLNVFAISAQNPTASPAGEQKRAEQVFKNIQVLKGIPADEVLPAMQFIGNSLGVECEFCHVQNANEKDDKEPKRIARQMIAMQLAINRDNFKGEQHVTCYTCHHGSAEHPSGAPAIPDEPTKPVETPKEASLPTADQLIDKYIQAVGGAEALKKINSRVEKGTINLGARQLPVEIFAKAPNKRLSIVHTPNGDNITAFDGRSGWLGNPGPRPPQNMTAQENEASGFDAVFYLPVELKNIFNRFHVRSVDKVGGREAVQVLAYKDDSLPVRLFFDKESGLLVRTLRYSETPLGPDSTQVDYADYRSESGVKIPFRWTVARPLGRFTINVTDVQQNVPIEDKKFEKPAAAPAKPGQ